MRPRRPSDRFDWITEAGCRGVELEVFFPLGQGGAATWENDRAKTICAACPVLDPCREWAVRVTPEFGIFGGLTPDERRTLRRTRRSTRRARPATPATPIAPTAPLIDVTSSTSVRSSRG